MEPMKFDYFKNILVFFSKEYLKQQQIKINSYKMSILSAFSAKDNFFIQDSL